MGGSSSKPQEVPPSSLLYKEWRPVPWQEKAGYLQFVRCFEPFPHHKNEKNEAQYLRILLYGPVGHGKSSFINSVDTVVRGRMTGQALADAYGGESFTKKYTTYKITNEEHETFYPFVFNDVMGLERDKGVRGEDIKQAMMGHVKDGYMFQPHSTLSTDDPYYNTNPRLSDKVHVLVFVIAADRTEPRANKDMGTAKASCASKKEHFVDSDALKQMRNVRLDISDRGIPQIAILTNIDQACPEVEADLKNVYKSKCVKKKMEVLSASLGIPLNCIFPVKNYHSEITPNDDLEILILMALKQMFNFGEDFVRKF